MDNTEDIEEISEHESDDDDLFEIDHIFAEVLHEIETIQQSIDQTLVGLDRIQTQLQNVIKHGDRSIDQIFDELHAEALKEIEETGQSTFGAKIVALFS